MLKNGDYGQLFFMRVDMVNSEQIVASISPEQYRKLNSLYTNTVVEEVQQWGGIIGAWQGDGAVAFLGTTGDEDDIMRSGEAMSRTILDRLYAMLPERRFRIGAASSPARFWTDVGRLIKSSGLVLAARLEDEARKVASGSVLIIPAEVYHVLDDSVKELYAPGGVLLGNVEVYAYIPYGAGELRKNRQAAPAAHTKAKIIFFDLFDPDWIFNGFSELYTALTIHPVEPMRNNFSAARHKDWLEARYRDIPLAAPIYSEEGHTLNKLTVYHAHAQGEEAIQAACFYKNGVLAFADRSWRERYGGKDIFRPEDTPQFMKSVLDFAVAYYGDCLGYSGRVMMMLHVINISGRKRVTSAGEQMPFVYQHDLCATINSTARDMGAGPAAEFLYNQIMKQSEM
ncbi:MAG: hypothetical protein A2270_00540 [Elusimicrobia bacterium RIFOXYA12_FULL_51_18]|nr:MAG: hypothetical protein A2270_00540 [Elusimicrobia bacterium RIFOXYA12_FULL_51_18]OGS28986.1 MAG: hypothetical protein A2218_08555 [Elusimicrobia bacterium RIFOXYA2_FULL_53_38]